MHIARRSSGGRGEYEISGTFRNLTPTDLSDRAITLVLGADWYLKTDTRLVLQGGKRRLRREREGIIQLPRQLAAALMMPPPVRARAAFGDGMPVLREGAYAIERISLANVQLVADGTAQLSVEDIFVENGDHHEEPVGFGQRIEAVRAIWAGAHDLPPELGALVAEHRRVIAAGGPIPVRAERIVSELQRIMTENAEDYGMIIRQGMEDVVPDVLRILRWHPPQPTVRVSDVAHQELEIRRRVIKEWKKWSNARGPESRRFKEEVRTAYRSTCIFCGLRLPKSPIVTSPGVDAAHILPWADFELDHPSNGICCCKLHHWAFDEGLLVLRWDSDQRQYTVEVPAEMAQRLRAEYPDFDLDELIRLTGPVPEARLPARTDLWPSPRCLDLLNESEGLLP